MKSKKPDQGYTIDARAFDVTLPETMATMSELLERGTQDEVRGVLRHVGLMMQTGQALPEKVARWVGTALQAIGEGVPPNKALALNRKARYGVQFFKVYSYMVNDLMQQGLSREDAIEVVSRFDPATNVSRDRGRAGALEERLKRFYQGSK